MKKRSKKPAGQCPISFALDTFGDRWSLLIIRDIVFKGKNHYREFVDSPEKISTNILANRLAKLEASNVLTKSVDPDNASRYVYQLTTKGKDLVPLLLEMAAWGTKYDPQPGVPNNIIGGAPKHLLHRMKTNRADLILEIMANVSG